jgi:hypothetical protein
MEKWLVEMFGGGFDNGCLVGTHTLEAIASAYNDILKRYLLKKFFRRGGHAINEESSTLEGTLDPSLGIRFTFPKLVRTETRADNFSGEILAT